MNISDPCIPWFYPKNNTRLESKTRICDPWETIEFKELMEVTPTETCSQCLPDCSETVYNAKVSTSPFRPCSFKNLGLSYLCNINQKGGKINPPIWGQQAIDQYTEEIGTVPQYISEVMDSNIRDFTVHSTDHQIFTATISKKPKYNAYERDIAMATFYFDTPTVFQYSREERMTALGYISQMGGLLGLCMGVSFISIIELIYWVVVKFVKNMFSHD